MHGIRLIVFVVDVNVSFESVSLILIQSKGGNRSSENCREKEIIFILKSDSSVIIFIIIILIVKATNNNHGKIIIRCGVRRTYKLQVFDIHIFLIHS